MFERKKEDILPLFKGTVYLLMYTYLHLFALIIFSLNASASLFSFLHEHIKYIITTLKKQALVSVISHDILLFLSEQHLLTVR